MSGQSQEPRERMRDLSRARDRQQAIEAGRYVRPARDEDDHGPEMLTSVACWAAVVLILVVAWRLWRSGVLS